MWTSDRWIAIKHILAFPLVHLSDIFFKHVSNCEHISEGGSEMVQSTCKLMKIHEDEHEGKWRYMKNYEDFWKFLNRFECNSEVILQSTCKCYGNRITNIDWIILDSEFFLRNPKFLRLMIRDKRTKAVRSGPDLGQIQDLLGPGPEIFRNLGPNQNQQRYENLTPIRTSLAVHESLLMTSYSMGWQLYMKWAMNGNLKFEIEISVSGRNIWYGRVLRGKVERRLNLVKDWSHKTFFKVGKILFKTFQNFSAF